MNKIIKVDKDVPYHYHKLKKRRTVNNEKDIQFSEYVEEYIGNSLVNNFYKPNSHILKINEKK